MPTTTPTLDAEVRRAFVEDVGPAAVVHTKTQYLALSAGINSAFISALLPAVQAARDTNCPGMTNAQLRKFFRHWARVYFREGE